MSLGIGAYKVGGVGQCSNMRRRYPRQPCERPPPGTNQAIATTLYEELQASNCVYKSRGAPAKGIRSPLV